MISMRRDDREFLWHDPELLDEDLHARVAVVPSEAGAPMTAWQNWGGDKSWPAPQAPAEGGWQGPPDPVLDGGPYDVVEAGPRSVRLRSRVEGRTGLQLERAVSVDEGGVVVETTLTNRSDRPRRFTPWEVMQVSVTAADRASPAAGVEVELEPGSTPVDLGRYWGAPTVGPHPRGLSVRFGGAVAKLGFPGSTGRVRARFADGAELRLEFDASPVAPDASPFQLWLQTPVDRPLPELDGWRPAHALVELEPVGPLRSIRPGEAVSLRARWNPLASGGRVLDQ